MPRFAQLGSLAIEALTDYLATGKDTGPVAVNDNPRPYALKYTMDGYNKLLDPEGYPAVKPPWGTLNAINLDTGEFAWKIPLGEFPELADKGIVNTGSENYGGPLVTAGGLLFIAATDYDRKFRAFDKATGAILWETELPAGTTGAPMTYMFEGKQYIVVAIGSREAHSAEHVALSLP